MILIKVFETLEEARDERRNSDPGGGWIFAAKDNGRAFLFPLDWTPTKILTDPILGNLSGELIN